MVPLDTVMVKSTKSKIKFPVVFKVLTSARPLLLDEFAGILVRNDRI